MLMSHCHYFKFPSSEGLGVGSFCRIQSLSFFYPLDFSSFNHFSFINNRILKVNKSPLKKGDKGGCLIKLDPTINPFITPLMLVITSISFLLI